MENTEQILENAIREGIRDGIKAKFSGYHSPLDKLVGAAIEAKTSEFRGILDEAIASCVKDSDFRTEITLAVRKSISKALVQRFGGEVEKQVNALKSDPTTRARITLAIEEIVKTS